MDTSSTVEDLKLCEQAYSYRTFFPMNILQYFQLILAVFSISMVLFLLKTDEFKRLKTIVRPSLRFVASLGILIYILGSVFSFICYAYITLLNFLNLNECKYVWKTFDCWLVRLPMYYCLVGYNTFHISLLMERFITTFQTTTMYRQPSSIDDEQANEPENGKIYGYLLGLFMIFIPFIVTLWVFANEDLNKSRSYCLAGSVSATDRIVFFTKLLFCFDLLAMFGDFFLLLYNRAQIKRRICNYNLERSFQLNEQQITIRYIFPFTFIHSISFLVYLIFFLSNRNYLNNSNLDEKEKFLYAEVNSLSKALYIAVVPIALLIYGRLRGKESKQWLRKQETNADLYFEIFRRQIS